MIQSLFNKYKINKTLYTWLISYLLILILPITFNFISYYYTENILTDKITEIDNEALSSSQLFIDSTIDNIADIASGLLSNNDLEEFSEWQAPLTPHQIYRLIDNNTIWNGFAPFWSYIETTYVYIPASNLILSNTSAQNSEEFFLADYSPNSSVQYHEWKNSVLLKETSGLVNLIINNSNHLFYISPKKEIGSGKIKYCTIVEYNMNNIIQAGVQGNKNSFYICKSDGEIIKSNSAQNLIHLTQFVSQAKKNHFDIVINGEKFIVSQIKSQSGDWYYGYLTPEHEYMKSILQARSIIIFAMLLSIICGCVFIFFSIRKNNKPLKELVRKFSGNGKNPANTIDEYEYINDMFIRTINEKEEYASRLSLQNDSLKEDILNNLIEGKINEKFSFTEQLKAVGIKWDGELYLIILFYIDNLSNLFFEQHSDDKESFNLAKLITTNISRELIETYYKVEMFEKNDLLVGIVNFKENQKSNIRDKLKQILSEINRFIKNEFNFNVFISFSDIHISLNGLSDAFSESILGIEYANMYDTFVTDYSEINLENSNIYPYTIEIEQHIINCIELGNYEKCKETIHILIEKYLSKSFSSVETVRYFAFDLLSTFLKIAIDKNNESLKELLTSKETYDIIAENGTSRNLLTKTEDVIERCINELKDIQKPDINNIYGKIKSFVEEHYDNPNLNVNEIANIFNINASQLSYQFKQLYSIGLLDYITQKRIEMAKTLLVTTDLPISKISEKVGYVSQRTFLRVFSKAENLTPGKYKQIFSK